MTAIFIGYIILDSMGMRIVTGVDLIYLPRFKKAAKFGGENFLRRVFLESELKGNNQHLAGIFAAKEAVMKALDLPKASWHNIQIIYKESGAPEAKIVNYPVSIITSSLSISHDGNYVIAQFVSILK